MATFLETPRFPDDIAYGSRGGPMYNTSIFTGSSGLEKRNINWQFPKHRYDVGYGARDTDKLYTLIEYFHSVLGPGIGFRYKDFGDYKSCRVTETPTGNDQPVAAIDGSTTIYQLIKQYKTGLLAQNRIIQKPIPDTVIVTVGGVVQEEPADYTLDTSTGIITFVNSQSPSSIRWGGLFDVPCRFEDDSLPIAYDDFEHGNIQVPIMEIRVDAELMELPAGCEEMSDYPMAKIVLETGQSLAIPLDYQYIVYREFTVEDGATLEVNGELIVIGEDDI